MSWKRTCWKHLRCRTYKQVLIVWSWGVGSALLSLKALEVFLHRILKTLDLATQRLLRLSAHIQTNATKALEKPKCCQLWTTEENCLVVKASCLIFFFSRSQLLMFYKQILTLPRLQTFVSWYPGLREGERCSRPWRGLSFSLQPFSPICDSSEVVERKKLEQAAAE